MQQNLINNKSRQILTLLKKSGLSLDNQLKVIRLVKFKLELTNNL